MLFLKCNQEVSVHKKWEEKLRILQAVHQNAETKSPNTIVCDIL